MRKRIILLACLLLFTVPAYAWQEGIDLPDNGSWKKQTIKIKDLDTGKTKKIKYRIHGVNRDRIKVYEDGEIKRYKIRR